MTAVFKTNYITNFKISQQKKPKAKSDGVKKNYILNPLSSVYRAISLITMLLIYNFNPNMKFITLTVEDRYNSLDVDWWKKEIYNFIRRLDRWFKKQPRYKDKKLRYIWVLEKHKYKPSYHVHMIIDCPYIPHQKGNNVLQRLWGYGITSISAMGSPKRFAKNLKYQDSGSSKELDSINSYAKVIKYTTKYLVKNFKKRYDDNLRIPVEERKQIDLYYISDGWERPKKEVLENNDDNYYRIRDQVFKKDRMKYFVRKYKMTYKVSYFKANGYPTRYYFSFLISTEFSEQFYKELLDYGN